MEVRQGISTEYAKEKFDVTLDETDLIRLANEYGISADQLTTTTAYLLLTLEAERFVLVQSPKYGRSVEEVRGQLRTNREQFATALSLATGLSQEEMLKRVLPETAQS